MAASHTLKLILAGVVLTLMMTGGAVAGPLEDAWAAYERGDYAIALRLWLTLAAQGNAFAQTNSALCTLAVGACLRISAKP